MLLTFVIYSGDGTKSILASNIPQLKTNSRRVIDQQLLQMKINSNCGFVMASEEIVNISENELYNFIKIETLK